MMGKLYKKLSATAIMLLMLASVVLAQDRTVSGTVTDGSGSAMPGVNVVIKGTSSGTTSDGSGKFTIMAGNDAVLLFSFIGYTTQQVTVGSRTVLDVSMAEDAKQLSEVVVTALGIERSTKTLAYSVTSVSGDKFTEAREINIGNALVGRVAGVNVSRNSSGPAGSTRIVIRGNKSLNGQNQPLYVVDGIPMDNSNFGQAGLWGGKDQGDGLTSINPDDIESMSVLKGASAAALYGSRGGNGVINITTKRGSKRKGLGIEFNSNYVLDKIYDQSEKQTTFGAGVYVDSTPDGIANGVATKPSTVPQAFSWGNQSWGPELDGSQVIQFDGVSRPYSNAGNNFDKFFVAGNTFTNTLALSGGGENQSFRFSVSDLRSNAIIPNSGFDRTNISLNVNSKYSNKLILDAKVMYSHEDAQNRPNLSDSPMNAVQSVWRTPPSVDVTTYYGDPLKPGGIPAGMDPAVLLTYGQGGAAKVAGQELLPASNNWGQNPYWAAHTAKQNDIRDRILASGSIRYNITDWLYTSGRIGLDWYTRRATNLTPEGTGYDLAGNRQENENRVQETNVEWMLGANKTFGKFNVNALVGGNSMHRKSEFLGLNGNGFNVQFFEAMNNTRNRTWGYGFDQSGINSLFASAEVGYNEILFLTATARQDWFSVLNPQTNSVLYPSVGASWIISDTFESFPSFLSFAKLRSSWAQVGLANIPPYSTLMQYSLNGNPHLGHIFGTFSSAGGTNGSINNPNLQPAVSTELEFGLDLRFLDNRIGLDLTYYRQKTIDDIVRSTISRASGFGTSLMNIGELSNNGIEVLLTGSPVRGALNWDISLNFARNINNVDYIAPGINELVGEEPRTRNVFIKHIVGQPFGMITGRVQQTTPDGIPIFNADGTPLASRAYVPIGNGVPRFTGGINNTFSYKSFNLDFLIDFKAGGDIYSGSNNRLTQWGLTEQSLVGRAEGSPLQIKGVTNTGTTANPVYVPVDRTLTPNEAQVYWSRVGGESTAISNMFLYDASFVKLRQFTFGYNFPKSMLSKTPIQNMNLSFVGRNLWVISKAIDNVDPESAYSTNAGAQGLEYFALPQTRSYGFNLRVTF